MSRTDWGYGNVSFPWSLLPSFLLTARCEGAMLRYQNSFSPSQIKPCLSLRNNKTTPTFTSPPSKATLLFSPPPWTRETCRPPAAVKGRLPQTTPIIPAPPPTGPQLPVQSHHPLRRPQCLPASHRRPSLTQLAEEPLGPLATSSFLLAPTKISP